MGAANPFAFRRQTLQPRCTMPKAVLVVEDNSLNMKLFLVLLNGAGYETLACVNGGEGLSVARQERSLGLVTDVARASP